MVYINKSETTHLIEVLEVIKDDHGFGEVCLRCNMIYNKLQKTIKRN